MAHQEPAATPTVREIDQASELDNATAVPAAPTTSLNVILMHRDSGTKDENDTIPPPDAPGSMPKYPVQSPTGSYEVVGVDAIWHNQYAGPEPDFIAFRTQYQSDINAMILKVAEHVRQGFYTVISINATPHMLTVICACEKMQSEFPADFFDEPEGV